MRNISDIAEVFTGHTLRSKVDNDPNGQCAVIQLKDLRTPDYTKLQNNPYKIAMHEIPPRQLLKNGDLLLLSKGVNNKALFYEGQFKNAVAVSAFTILRLKTSHIKPEFLAWYINSQKAQEYFNTQRAGTTTLNLSKKAIEELQVPLPPLAKQELMMKLTRQYELYKSLVVEYQHNLKLLIENILNNHLKNK